MNEEANIEDVARGKGTLEVQMAFEEESELACPEVVSQKEETSSEEVVEAC
jgi:hypothetical protein